MFGDTYHRGIVLKLTHDGDALLHFSSDGTEALFPPSEFGDLLTRNQCEEAEKHGTLKAKLDGQWFPTKEGDTLSSIAEEHRVDVDKLMKLNLHIKSASSRLKVNTCVFKSHFSTTEYVVVKKKRRRR
jgi:hypothetical protein